MNDYQPQDYVYDEDEPQDNRIRNLRIVLFGIILLTVPFYLVGAGLLVASTLGNSGRNDDPDTVALTETPATATPIGGEVSATPTLRPTQTPLGSPTVAAPLISTPGQFIPPRPTNTLTFTPVPTIVIPTSTNAPTLTPIPPTATTYATLAPASATPTLTFTPSVTTVPPTATVAAPTDTPVPPPTDTPVPPPTDTPVPPPTNTPVPPPTNTPVPPPTETPIPFEDSGATGGEAAADGGGG